MDKRLFAGLAVVMLAALAILALPGRSEVNLPGKPEKPGQQIQCESARWRAEWQKVSDELERLRRVELPQQLAKLKAQGENLQAALEERLARIKAQRSDEIEERAREWTERAAEKAETAARRAAIAISDDGDRGWLGVTIAEVTAEKAKELKLPAERGVIITEVQVESPAAKAGLKSNDVVTEFNGQRVEGTAQFRRLVRETPAGRTGQLTVWRDGRVQSLAVQVGKFRDRLEGRVRVFGPKDFHFDLPDFGYEFWTSRAPTLGISGEDLSGQLGSYFGAPDSEGVLVREVKSGSPADKAGLKAGDVIIKIDGERVRTVSDLRAKMREKRDKKTVGVSAIRKGAEMSLNVEVEQPRAPAERKRYISRRIYL